jgi:hypothetical protein
MKKAGIKKQKKQGFYDLFKDTKEITEMNAEM